ncbi:four helix bundle protein [Thalassotalea sp. HSM 43]|uniref:four helix bundle protein n=1 Tax=Thalassotalea sp. HSM 43 TaxID=2552945 RepID=UPI00108146B0|nr:four helix bundle protein [Thalassotalea sp. HSM 43]QBY03142.1 four helix bundle protein [Thalassotalea sp. HSM 43]
MKFEQLTVWQRASKLTCDAYAVLANCKDFGFKDQITRSALSIPSNIAEGEERETHKESIRFLYYAKGSAGELVTQLYIGIKLKLIEPTIGLAMVKETKELAAMLAKLIKIRKQSRDKEVLI